MPGRGQGCREKGGLTRERTRRIPMVSMGKVLLEWDER